MEPRELREFAYGESDRGAQRAMFDPGTQIPSLMTLPSLPTEPPAQARELRPGEAASRTLPPTVLDLLSKALGERTPSFQGALEAAQKAAYPPGRVDSDRDLRAMGGARNTMGAAGDTRVGGADGRVSGTGDARVSATNLGQRQAAECERLDPNRYPAYPRGPQEIAPSPGAPPTSGWQHQMIESGSQMVNTAIARTSTAGPFGPSTAAPFGASTVAPFGALSAGPFGASASSAPARGAWMPNADETAGLEAGEGTSRYPMAPLAQKQACSWDRGRDLSGPGDEAAAQHRMPVPGGSATHTTQNRPEGPLGPPGSRAPTSRPPSARPEPARVGDVRDTGEAGRVTGGGGRDTVEAGRGGGGRDVGHAGGGGRDAGGADDLRLALSTVMDALRQNLPTKEAPQLPGHDSVDNALMMLGSMISKAATTTRHGERGSLDEPRGYGGDSRGQGDVERRPERERGDRRVAGSPSAQQGLPFGYHVDLTGSGGWRQVEGPMEGQSKEYAPRAGADSRMSIEGHTRRRAHGNTGAYARSSRSPSSASTGSQRSFRSGSSSRYTSRSRSPREVGRGVGGQHASRSGEVGRATRRRKSRRGEAPEKRPPEGSQLTAQEKEHIKQKIAIKMQERTKELLATTKVPQTQPAPAAPSSAATNSATSAVVKLTVAPSALQTMAGAMQTMAGAQWTFMPMPGMVPLGPGGVPLMPMHLMPAPGQMMPLTGPAVGPNYAPNVVRLPVPQGPVTISAPATTGAQRAQAMADSEKKILDMKAEWKQKQARVILFMKTQERFYTLERELLNKSSLLKQRADKGEGGDRVERDPEEWRKEASLLKSLGEMRVLIKGEIEGMQRERTLLEAQLATEEKRLEAHRLACGSADDYARTLDEGDHLCRMCNTLYADLQSYLNHIRLAHGATFQTAAVTKPIVKVCYPRKLLSFF